MIDGRIEVPRLEMQHGHRIVAKRVERIGLDQARVGGKVFAAALALHIGAEQRGAGTIARHQLDPEIPHLVGRLLAPHHTLRRTMRIADVPGGVVVDVFHCNGRTLRQHDRLDIAIDFLPPEIPVGNCDQPARAAVRQRCRGGHPPRQIVRVRLNRDHVNVSGKNVSIGDRVIALTRRNVNRLAAQPQTDRRARRRIVGEIEAD